MMTTASSVRSLAARAFVSRALIAVQGVVTLIACVLMFPVGAVLVVANGVMAVLAHGAERKLFLGFAVTGAVICLVIGLGLVAAAPMTVQVGHAVPF